MSDKEAIEIFKKLLENPKALTARRSDKKTFTAKEREALHIAIGALSLFVDGQTRAEKSLRARKEKRERESFK